MSIRVLPLVLDSKESNESLLDFLSRMIGKEFSFLEPRTDSILRSDESLDLWGDLELPKNLTPCDLDIAQLFRASDGSENPRNSSGKRVVLDQISVDLCSGDARADFSRLVLVGGLYAICRGCRDLCVFMESKYFVKMDVSLMVDDICEIFQKLSDVCRSLQIFENYERSITFFLVCSNKRRQILQNVFR